MDSDTTLFSPPRVYGGTTDCTMATEYVGWLLPMPTPAWKYDAGTSNRSCPGGRGSPPLPGVRLATSSAGVAVVTTADGGTSPFARRSATSLSVPATLSWNVGGRS